MYMVLPSSGCFVKYLCFCSCKGSILSSKDTLWFLLDPLNDKLYVKEFNAGNVNQPVAVSAGHFRAINLLLATSTFGTSHSAI